MLSFGATEHFGRSGDDLDQRLKALASAAICAVNALTFEACTRIAGSLHDEALRDLKSSTKRGDESAAGVGQQDLGSGFAAQFDAADNQTVTFSLNAP